MQSETSIESGSTIGAQSLKAKEVAKKLNKALLKFGNSRNILIVSKIHDPKIIELTKLVATHLIDCTSKQLCWHESESDRLNV